MKVRSGWYPVLAMVLFIILYFVVGLLLLSQEEPGFISLITPQNIPPGGTNNFVSSHGLYSPELVRH